MNIAAWAALAHAKTVACVLFSIGCIVSHGNPYDHSKLSTVRLDWAARICSGVATGPNTIATAAHCIEGLVPGEVLVNGLGGQWSLIANDDSDHVLLHVTQHQKYTSPLIQHNFQSGETLYIWGNPQGLEGVLRIGHVAGTRSGSGVWCVATIKAKTCPVIYLDANMTQGDSGAGLFDVEGNLVGLESAGVSGRNFVLPYFYPIAFSASQLALARG